MANEDWNWGGVIANSNAAVPLIWNQAGVAISPGQEEIRSRMLEYLRELQAANIATTSAEPAQPTIPVVEQPPAEISVAQSEQEIPEILQPGALKAPAQAEAAPEVQPVITEPVVSTVTPELQAPEMPDAAEANVTAPVADDHTPPSVSEPLSPETVDARPDPLETAEQASHRAAAQPHIQAIQEQLNSQQAEIEELRAQLAEATALNATQVEQIGKLTQQLSEVDTEIANAKAQAEEAQNELAAIQAQEATRAAEQAQANASRTNLVKLQGFVSQLQLLVDGNGKNDAEALQTIQAQSKELGLEEHAFVKKAVEHGQFITTGSANAIIHAGAEAAKSAAEASQDGVLTQEETMTAATQVMDALAKEDTQIVSSGDAGQKDAGIEAVAQDAASSLSEIKFGGEVQAASGSQDFGTTPPTASQQRV